MTLHVIVMGGRGEDENKDEDEEVQQKAGFTQRQRRNRSIWWRILTLSIRGKRHVLRKTSSERRFICGGICADFNHACRSLRQRKKRGKPGVTAAESSSRLPQYTKGVSSYLVFRSASLHIPCCWNQSALARQSSCATGSFISRLWSIPTVERCILFYPNERGNEWVRFPFVHIVHMPKPYDGRCQTRLNHSITNVLWRWVRPILSCFHPRLKKILTCGMGGREKEEGEMRICHMTNARRGMSKDSQAFWDKIRCGEYFFPRRRCTFSPNSICLLDVSSDVHVADGGEGSTQSVSKQK